MASMSPEGDNNPTNSTSHPTQKVLCIPNIKQGVSTTAEKASTQLPAAQQPYSIYTRSDKWIIVTIASIAAVFSPLAANSYFPAIPIIAAAFHKSTEAINLSVTVYMIPQGVAPMIWGPMADYVGRRPIFLACLGLLMLSCIGLALTPTKDYWLLLFLRGVQAAGSASTLALGGGTIADIATSAERGGFMGLFTAGTMIGLTIGPVFGGILTEYLGWRSIFWFLGGGALLCFLFLFLILPETLRSVVGNGSYRPAWIYRAIVPYVGQGTRKKYPQSERPLPKPYKNPLRLLLYPDVVMTLLVTGIVNANAYAVITSTSSLFKGIYPYLSETEIGLCYLSIGGGMFSGSLFSGRLMDRDYNTIKNKMIRELEASTSRPVESEQVTKEESFPIERARLRTMPIYSVLLSCLCIGYGWMLEKKVTIAGPLIFQFAIGFTVIAIMNTVSTLIVDIAPNEGSSISACNNVIRCTLGAVVVSIIDLMIKAIGVGWTYTVFGCFCFLSTPLLLTEIYLGYKIRNHRREKGSR